MSTSPANAVVYEPKNMRFRRLGPSGLRVSLFSLGGWLTLGGSVNDDLTREIMDLVFRNGIQTFDTAEVYGNGSSERSMGKAIRDLGSKRSEVVLITKIFFGTGNAGDPNGSGLSRKHVVEGTDASLERAQLKYWDVVIAHCPDVSVPMAEVVKAFNHLIQTGRCFYWGCSAWSAEQIQEAYGIAERLGLDPPLADQSQYSALHREPVESSYTPLYSKYGFSVMDWSPLAGGILSGKYNDGIPTGSRFDTNKDTFSSAIDSLRSPEGQAKIAKVRELTKIADKLGCSVAVLSLAWAARNPNVATVIIGASKKEQLLENIKALEFIDKLTPAILEEIEGVLDNKPEKLPDHGRAM